MTQPKQKTVLIQTDFALAKSGFGRNAKSIIEHLYHTGKYKIVHYCVGFNVNNPELKRTPWKSIGCIPENPEEIQRIRQDPNLEKVTGYGGYYLDKVIKEEKPDVYIAIQDIWGVDFAINKKWFNKITSVIWTTLDSLPILPSAIETAKKTKHYWIWSNFATKALHKLGFKHAETVHGAIEDKFFFRHSELKRKELRKLNNIPEDAFVIGFVFRNQLRKSVPNLIEGFKTFIDQNPQVKNPYLLLHTHFGEGWNIPKLTQEHGVDPSKILTTYMCPKCGRHEVKAFTGMPLNCRFCGGEHCTQTTHPGLGVTEEQLNDVYNLMDVYCHPFTSGGQEMPIQEAKLTELITLVTNYSCGEEMCEPEARSMPLDWSEYREIGSEFIKASTLPSSIAKQLKKVYELHTKNYPIKRQMEKDARQWVLNGFSALKIGKFLEDFIDKSPETTYNFDEKEETKDPYFAVDGSLADDEWILALYHNILKMHDVDKENDGFKYWKNELGKGVPRQHIEQFFRKKAFEENAQLKNGSVTFNDFLDKEDKKRVLLVMPESAGDIYLCSSLYKSIKKRYPEHKFYVATKPQFKDVVLGNPLVDKWIEYNPMMDSLVWLEGSSNHDGYFDVAYVPHLTTQRSLTYMHNGVDKIDFDLKN